MEYARQAGDRAREGLALEEAATHYEHALNALEFSGTGDPAVRCDLLTALGAALYRVRDRRFRKILADAAAAARSLGDGRRLARVAIAHNPKFARAVGRTDDEVVALVEDALAAFPPDDDPLRAQLLAVLALELAWSPDSERRRALLAEAKEMAQRLGDPRGLADVLMLRRWADTDPADLDARLAGASELVALGEELEDAEAMSHGHVWRGMAHYELGDVKACVAGVESAAALVGQLRQPVFATEVAGGRTMNALLLGRLDDAAHLMVEEQVLGTETGMPPRTVMAHLATQRFVLQFERGQPQATLEAVGLMDPFVDGAGTSTWVWRAIAGVAHAEAGDVAEAGKALEELASGGFAEFARNTTWLGGMGLAGRLSAALGDVSRAESIYELLLPYAGRACMLGAAVFGPVDPVLGLLAATRGRLDDAHHHFDAAAEFCRRMGLPTWLARSRQEWAEMLVARGAPGDKERAMALAAEALAGAESLGMAGVAARARALLASA